MPRLVYGDVSGAGIDAVVVDFSAIGIIHA